MIIPYSHHGNTIYKVMLLPQQYLFLCVTSLMCPSKAYIGTDVRGKILDSENSGEFDE